MDMEPRKPKVEPSSSNNFCLHSEIKRFKGESSQSHIGSSNEIGPSETDDPGNSPISAAMMVAMDNQLILQEIFKYLSPADQRICCEVSEKWRTIAGPMIFEYHLKVDYGRGIRVNISTGYLNALITEREFPSEGEIEYVESLKRKNCFVSIDFIGCPWESALHFEYFEVYGPDVLVSLGEEYCVARDFVKKLRTQVYRLKCSHNEDIYKFIREREARVYPPLLPYFPNCEEYHEGALSPLDWFSVEKITCPMTHLRKVYLGSFDGQLNRNKILAETPKVLQMFPNLQEIHGVPFTMIGQFEKAKKLYSVSSIRFHRVEYVNLGTEAFKTMVQLGIKFKFLRIQGNSRQEWMKWFEDLLKIGKDTLQHVELYGNGYGPFIDIPARMSALTHVTLKSCRVALNLPTGFNFSEYFPKLTAITFAPMTIAEWKSGSSWWNSWSKGVPGWEEFRKGIRNLRCDGPLSDTVQRNLLRKFPSVSRIDFVSMDHSDVDGIVYK